MPIIQAERSQPIDRETNGPFHNSHLTVTQTVSRGEEGCCLPSTPTPQTPPLSVHLHIPQERTHLNRSYQHRIPLCSTVGACICSIYVFIWLYVDGRWGWGCSCRRLDAITSPQLITVANGDAVSRIPQPAPVAWTCLGQPQHIHKECNWAEHE